MGRTGTKGQWKIEMERADRKGRMRENIIRSKRERERERERIGCANVI